MIISNIADRIGALELSAFMSVHSDGALEIAGAVFGAGPSMEGNCVPPRLSVNFCPRIDDGSLEVTGNQFAAGPTSMNSGCSNTVFTCPRID
jgi:hypothetical protein